MGPGMGIKEILSDNLCALWVNCLLAHNSSQPLALKILPISLSMQFNDSKAISILRCWGELSGRKMNRPYLNATHQMRRS